MTPVSTERLKEILAGCEGAQGGPWKLDKFACYVWAPSEKGGDFPIMDDLAKDGRVGMLRGWGYYTGHGSGALGLPHDEAAKRQRLTGEHVANCDPATVSAIVSELLSLRASPTDGELVEFRKPDKAFEAWRDTLPDKHWAKHDLSACRLGWDAALALSSAELTEWRAAGFENGRWIARAMTAESALSTAEARALEKAAAAVSGLNDSSSCDPMTFDQIAAFIRALSTNEAGK